MYLDIQYDTYHELPYNIIDGKNIASKLLDNLQYRINKLKKINNIIPSLAIIQVGDNESSNIYISNKIKKCEQVGIKHFYYHFLDNISEEKLLSQIDNLNNSQAINGIIVQLPLPKHISVNKVINAIRPSKDVDGFHPENIGKMLLGQESLVSCTPKGIMYLLDSIFSKNLHGKNVLVIGRSNIVGKPTSYLLLQRNATVNIAHSYTKNIDKLCYLADIIIVAVGKAKYIKQEWVKKGAVIIDVGINSMMVEGKKVIYGDVDFDFVKNQAKYITPVPGGVGPMTVACLMENTVIATCRQSGLEY